MKYERMNNDELFDAMGNPEHIFIAKTSFWSARNIIILGWILKIALLISFIVMYYGLNNYDHSLMEMGRI